MPKKMNKSKIIEETAWSFLSKGVTFVLFYILNIYLARVLGVDLFGQWSFFYSILSIVLLFSYFGINASSKKFVAEHNKTENLSAVLRSALSARLLFSFIFSVLLAVFHNKLAFLINKPELSLLFLFSAPLVFFSGVTEFLKDIFIGFRKNKYNFLINVIEYGLKLFLVWLFFDISISLATIINSYSIGLLVATVFGLLVFYFNFYCSAEKTNKSYFKDIIRYSIPLFAISIGFWTATEIDTIMLGYIMSSYDVGIYSAAKQIVIKLPHIAVAISMGTMPLFAKLNGKNHNKLKKLFGKLLKYNSLIYGIISIIILSSSFCFMKLIYGADYASSYQPLMLLLPYLIMFSFSVFLSSFLDYQGLAKKRAINLSITVVLNIILNYILIPKYGINGAAIATSVSYIPYFMLNWIEVKKEFTKYDRTY